MLKISMIIQPTVTAKANKVLGMVKRSFEHLNSCMISKLFTILIRPTLEYSNPIWGPPALIEFYCTETIPIA